MGAFEGLSDVRFAIARSIFNAIIKVLRRPVEITPQKRRYARPMLSQGPPHSRRLQ